jgi:dolichyl-phosphate-mannose--protein O-mannosyl transferase
MGVAAGYVPWLLYLNRTVFQFYTIAFEPYLVLALTCVIGIILGRSGDSPDRRASGARVVVVFLVMAVLVSAFFYPLWTGMQIPFRFWQVHIWLPGWR